MFADFDPQPDYENKKGTVVDYTRVPLTSIIRTQIGHLIGDSQLLCEGNYYYNKSCGIGFHGDTERRRIVGIRLGTSIPLVYRWFHKGKPVSDNIILNLNHGDMYIMSDWSVGYNWRCWNSNTACCDSNWKCSSLYTLRHAAGAKKYTTYKK